MLRRVENNEADSAKDLALMMFRTATLRSGFMLQDTADFAESIEQLISHNLGIPFDEQSFEAEEEIFDDDDDAANDENAEDQKTGDLDNEEHDEL